MSPDPRTDIFFVLSAAIAEANDECHRFWVPGSLLRSAPE